MKLTIKNTFHNTEANVILTADHFDSSGEVELTVSQSRRAWKQLCGNNECCCFGNHVHVENQDGEQTHQYVTTTSNEKFQLAFCNY